MPLKTLRNLLWGLCYLCIVPSLPTQVVAQEPFAVDSDRVRQIRLEAFVRSDLPAAAQVESYASDLQKRTPGLQIDVHDVLKDRLQLLRLHELTKKSGKSKAVVPSFYACNRMVFGFADAEKSGPKIEQLLTVSVYTRDTCQRCQAAKTFIAKLNKRWPALRFQIYEITYDGAARATWEQLCRAAQLTPGLPAIDFAGRVFVGYESDETSGAQLERFIEEVAGVVTEQVPQQPNDAQRPQTSRQPKSDIPQWISPLYSNIAMASFASPASTSQHQEMETQTSDIGLQFDDLLLPSEATESELGEAMSETVSTQTSDTVDAGIDSIRLPYFGTLRVQDIGLPGFTLAVGLVDGFNPCAMWVLVFLLSVLVNVGDRRKIIAIAGSFVLISGLAYFAFMAAWLNLFMLIGIVRPVQILLGGLAIAIGAINIKDFVAFKKGLSFSIPESSKPGLYRRVRAIVNAKYLSVAIAGAVVLAVVVNMIELLCTAGLPALYTQVLTMQQLPIWENYLYLGLYISAYMFDDTLLLAAVVMTLSHRKMQEREGQWLKLVSGVVILLLGLVMIFRPAWLQLAN